MLSILKTWVYGFTGIATVMSFMPFAAMLVFLAPFYEISPIQIHFIVKGTKEEEEEDDKQRSNDDDKQRSTDDDKQRSTDDDDETVKEDETVKNTASSTSSSEDSSDRPSETS
jgi:hypothetical protein